MHWQRKAGVAMMTAGTLLLAAFVVPTVCGRAMSHLAVAAFRAQGGSYRLWDGARVLAYERTLGVSMPHPEAVLKVPKVGIEVPVYEGTGELTLNRGVGHVAGTAMPGDAGNVAITGHRDGFFRGLKDVAVGDRIELRRSAGTDAYVVDSIRIVSPKDTSVLKDADASTLTLITCYPFHYVGAAPQRYVVRAALVTRTD